MALEAPRTVVGSVLFVLGQALPAGKVQDQAVAIGRAEQILPYSKSIILSSPTGSLHSGQQTQRSLASLRAPALF